MITASCARAAPTISIKSPYPTPRISGSAGRFQKILWQAAEPEDCSFLFWTGSRIRPGHQAPGIDLVQGRSHREYHQLQRGRRIGPTNGARDPLDPDQHLALDGRFFPSCDHFQFHIDVRWLPADIFSDGRLFLRRLSELSTRLMGPISP